MNKKFLIYGVGLTVLAVLVYLQFSHWKHFDWATFWSQWARINPLRILTAVGLIYITYLLRALRWKILIRPIRPQASWVELASSTVVGFTGLALLGVPEN